MLLSIVILNFNTAPLTIQCIRSIKRHCTIPASDYEIIIVDNHSREEDVEKLTRECQGIPDSQSAHLPGSDALTTAAVTPPPHILLIISKLNTGFGGGNMLGANQARGKYILFLNSDVLLTEDCIKPLCDMLENNPHIGCITPQQMNGSGALLPTFGHEPSVFTAVLGTRLLEKLFPRRYPRLYTPLVEITNASYISGSFMLFPLQVFYLAGGFDTNIFLYYEEYDICTRLSALGYKSVIVPAYTYTHLVGESTKHVKSETTREMFISQLYVYKKHHRTINYWLYKWIVIIKIALLHKRLWYLLPSMVKGENLAGSMRHRVR